MLPFLGDELFTLKTKLDSLDVNAFINSVMCLSDTYVYHTHVSITHSYHTQRHIFSKIQMNQIFELNYSLIKSSSYSYILISEIV